MLKDEGYHFAGNQKFGKIQGAFLFIYQADYCQFAIIEFAVMLF